MNSNYTSVVGLVIAFLFCNQPAFSQTTFFDCSTDTLLLCVNDSGVSLPDSNQLLVGTNTPGAVSCGVHVTQSRTITSTCVGSIDYYVTWKVNDSVHEVLQPMKTVYVDFSNQVELAFDTRNASSLAIRKNGLPYTEGCDDVHRIRWVAIDKCGNEVVCEELLKLYDCQSPVISEQQQIIIVTLPVGGVIHTNAKHFEREIKDDCVSQNSFLYSFESQIYRPDTVISCEKIPAFGVELPIVIWIADNGNDTNCNGQIEWSERGVFEMPTIFVYTDNFGGCDPNWDDSYVAGKVTTQDDRPIAEVAVNMTSPGHVYPTYVTSGDGEYLFNHIVTPEVVTITAYRNDNHRNGVSTLDLVKIQKHLLGINPVTNPYTILAMDANCSQNVSAIDLIELRKLILGINTELPWCQSWRFINKKFDFNDPSHPWPNPSEITLSLTGSVGDADFIGIKIGDANNTVMANLQQPLPRSPNAIVEFEVNDQSYTAGDIIDIPVALESDASVLGFQFTLSSSDLEFINVGSGLVNLDENEFNVADSDLSMSWFSLESIHVGSEDKLFTIQARAKRSGSLRTSLRISSDITEAELYDAAEIVYEPVLSVQSNDEGVSLLSLSPNPASDHVSVAFYLSEGTAGTIQFVSLDKKIAYTNDVIGQTGRNEVIIPVNELTSGVLICTLQSPSGICTQKVIVIR